MREGHFTRELVGEFIRWAVIDDGVTLEQRIGRLNFHAVKATGSTSFGLLA